ncbi:MAG TPA: trypsin-like serine protease [Phycisphaerales bacterium]|nr:trypsin-like serine protease [Phycisphaerales bacterium]
MAHKQFLAMYAAGMMLSFGFLVKADTLILNSGARLTAPVLADRPSGVVLDLGYTVLVVPKEHIVALAPEVSVYDPNKPDPEEGVPAFIAADSLYSTAESEIRTLEECYKRVSPAVVMVSTPVGLGSGFFINPQGYLITNYHVIERETQITVTLFEQSRSGFERKNFRDVRIVALNPFIDLALLKVQDEATEAFPFVPLSRPGTVQVGQSTFAVGNPLGLERSLSEGTITTVSRAFEGLVYIQTNADLNPGNSGGPLFDMAGRVIGVANMSARQFGGLGFAIPIHYVRDFIDHYESFAYDKDNPNTGYRYLQPDARLNKEKPDLSEF